MGCIQDFQFVRHDFHLSGAQIRIDRVFRPVANLAAHRQDKFTSNFLRRSEGLGVDFSTKNDLDKTSDITKVREYETTMIPAPVYPAHNDRITSDICCTQISAVVCSSQTGALSME